MIKGGSSPPASPPGAHRPLAPAWNTSRHRSSIAARRPWCASTFFVSLAILLMVLDARFRYADNVRQVVALAAYPLERIAMAPVDLFHGTVNYFSTTTALRAENAELKMKQLRAAPELLQLEALKQENKQLRRVLEAQQRLPRKSIFAEILYAARDPFSRKVVIDKGSQSGIQPGEPVIDDVGVIGQVTRVYLLMSEVTLLSDKDQAIPLQVLRTGLRAVAYGGAEGGMLDLRFMPANADIRNGDVLVTSGIDGTYPPGLPVATVARIERDAAYAFARITLAPTAGIDRYRQVLVLSNEAEPACRRKWSSRRKSRQSRSASERPNERATATASTAHPVARQGQLHRADTGAGAAVQPAALGQDCVRAGPHFAGARLLVHSSAAQGRHRDRLDPGPVDRRRQRRLARPARARLLGARVSRL